jgi:DMSO/TMAO reductase YedYZ heme-binding membrane subunit
MAMTRLIRHVALLIAVGSTSAAAWLGGAPVTRQDRLSLLTAWLCCALLTAALAIAPAQALRTGRPLLNHIPRRDLGIWAAITGLLHTVLATNVVMTPAYFRAYIVGPPESPLPGWAGWIATFSIIGGYVVAIIFLLLLGLSNNRALRRLGPARWKRWQRWAYSAAGLTFVHGVVFQVIEGRTGAWLAMLLMAGGALFALQLAGRRAVSHAAKLKELGELSRQKECGDESAEE